jgi:SAM-dependent methyltransferase
MDLLNDGAAIQNKEFSRGEWSWIAPPRSFNPSAPEWLDRPDMEPALVQEEFELLADTNRRFDGHGIVLRHVQRFIDVTAPRSWHILDLGTGSADIPRAIATWAREAGVAVTIVGVDSNPIGVRLATAASADWPEIRIEQQDMLGLPYETRSFDLVICSLALHHLADEDAVRVLRRMQELARVGFIVNDVRRNWLSIWATELLARTVIQSTIARNDAPQSTRAAFTPRELDALARRAGLVNYRISRHHGIFRMVLEGWPAPERRGVAAAALGC